ncbi:AAA family ATPase [Spirillospora sp. NPDC000708]
MSMTAHGQPKHAVPLPADFEGEGEANDFHVAVSEISTKGGDHIAPPPVGVTVIVGGNNSGKSTFLRDLWIRLSRPKYTIYKPILIEEVKLHRDGSDADALDWFRNKWAWSGNKYKPGFVDDTGTTTALGNIRKFVKQGSTPYSLADIVNHVVQRGDLHKRVELVEPVDQRDGLQESPRHPIHRIQDDPDLLQRVQQFSRRIFRQELTLDRLGGKTQLRVGVTDVPPPRVDQISPEYIKSLATLEPLENQGDGMKSLMGLLIPLVTGSCRILLIDEPEAFLHPPQAKILGKVLGEISAESGIQIFLATHDRNLLVGLLEAQAPVAVVRLDRKDNDTAVHQLKDQLVRELWDEPVLRYSNVLDGLFHRAVVLAESDGDCRFYAASLDGVTDPPFSPGDIQFVPVGGKDGFGRVVRALRSVAVPLVVIADLDVLNDAKRTRIFVEMLGGKWDHFKGDYEAATRQFHVPRTPKTRAEVLELAARVLTEDPGKRYDKESERLLQAAIRADRSPWQDLKEFGIRAFKGGVATVAAQDLLDKLESVGAVLVHEGELERLAPSVQRKKGPEWIVEALQLRSHLGDRAQAHILRVIGALESQMS